MTPLQEGLLGATIIGIAIYLAITFNFDMLSLIQ